MQCTNWLMLTLLPLVACTAAPVAPVATMVAERSILATSTPAAGTTIDGPVYQLRLRFDPPARLLEVTVSDASGQMMPMMVTAVGEVGDYSLPLAGLEAGRYTVNWRASIGGNEHSGSFGFAVR